MPSKVEALLKSTDAKLFWNGRSQAVRLPKEFRFAGDRVRVSRMGAGVLLQPINEAQSEAQKETPRSGWRGLTRSREIRIFPERRKGADLVAAMQASPYKEISLEPERVRMPVREIEF